MKTRQPLRKKRTQRWLSVVRHAGMVAFALAAAFVFVGTLTTS